MVNFSENPHLRNILKEVDSAKEPELALEHYYDEPIVSEFINACLEIFPSE